MTYLVGDPAPLIGQPIVRVDGRLKVTGGARYAADNSVDNVACASLVCSTIPLGSVRRIDSAHAHNHPGVLAVLADFTGFSLPFNPRQVAFFGQPIAVVVASSVEAAMHGASLVAVRFSNRASPTDIDDRGPRHGRGRKPGIPPWRPRQHAARVGGCHRPQLHHRPQQPQSDGGARHHHEPLGRPADGLGQGAGINSAQEALAAAFAVPIQNVRVISPFVGGAFGSAGRTWPHQILAAFAARTMRRPVKLVLTRKQMYSGIGYRPDQPAAPRHRRESFRPDHRTCARGPYRVRPLPAV